MKSPSGIELAALALVLAGPAAAKVVEEQLDVPVEVTDAYGKPTAQVIKVTVFTDNALPGPRPVLVISHGRDTDAAARAAYGRARYGDASRWFAARGFLVAVPTRIGYGVSGGPDLEDSGGCGNKRYGPGFDAAAQQVVATLRKVRERLDVAPDRAVLLGQSYGGASTVAAVATNPAGVAAGINFAGGSGGDPKERPGRPCSPVQMERAYASYGATARIPMLWLYAENDRYWGADTPRDWFKAYQGAGAPAEFVSVPPQGEDGHRLFTQHLPTWQPLVADFLRRQGYEMKDPAP